MGYLIIGFILGVAVSWFWQTQFSGVPAFKQLMQKELAVNGQLGSVTQLKNKLDILEKRLAEMEDTTRKPLPDEPEIQPEKLTVISSRDDDIKKVDISERARKREEVVRLWKENNSVSEIASKTNLGRGEVELIITLQKSRVKEGRCS